MKNNKISENIELTDDILNHVVGGAKSQNRQTINNDNGDVSNINQTGNSGQTVATNEGSINVDIMVKNDIRNNKGDVTIKSPVKIDNKGGGNININL